MELKQRKEYQIYQQSIDVSRSFSMTESKSAYNQNQILVILYYKSSCSPINLQNVMGPLKKRMHIVDIYPWLSRKEIRFSNMHPASHTSIPLT